MAKLKIPTPLRAFTGGQAEVQVNGENVHDVMGDLMEQFPELKQHLYDGDNELRAFVNLFLAEDNVRDLQGLDTPMGDDDTLRIIPSIAGG